MTQLRRFACLTSFLICLTVHAAPSFAQGSGGDSPPSWKAVQTAAQKEGKVVIYSQVQVPVLTRIKADFEKANPGITLEFVRMAGTPIIAKVEQERKSGADGADVLQQTEMLWFQAQAKEGLLRAPSGPAARNWPAEAMRAGVAPILALEPIGLIVYNTNIVKSSITGYADLLRPEFKGGIGVIEPGLSPSGVAWYDWLEKTQGAGFVAKLAAQSPRQYTSALPSTQAVASGELKVSTWGILSASKPLLKQGAPITIVLPKPGLAVIHGGAVLGWAKRPNAAMVLMDYLMSERGQATWAREGEYASPLPGIPNALNWRALTPFDQAHYTPEVIRTRATALKKLLLQEK